MIVEDGQGLASADSLCSTAEATAYHSARGNTAWADLSTPNQEAALIKATDYIERTYGARWTGRRKTELQALAWPRYDVPRKDYGGIWPSDEVPKPVREACAVLALASGTGAINLSLDLTNQSTAGGAVKRKKIGPIEIEYTEGVVATSGSSFRSIEGMLAPLLRGGPGMIPVVRC